jgi:hypothetical protein
VLSLCIFFVSCVNDQYANRVSQVPLPMANPRASFSKGAHLGNLKGKKDKEQLYIKRDNLRIQSKEEGSTTGSLWADSASPKNLATEFKPSKAGDVVTVHIPEDLQYKPDEGNAPSKAGATAAPENKKEPVKSFKFEVVGIEPGGDVYLRGMKSYVSDTGDQRNIVVMAKVPRRNINNSQINANDLSEVAVNENSMGSQSEYTSTGWDKMVSKKITDSAPDLKAQTALAQEQQKEIDTQKKALAEQKKALDDQADRLRKDRARLDATKTAQAPASPNAAPGAAPASPAQTPATPDAGAAKP